MWGGGGGCTCVQMVFAFELWGGGELVGVCSVSEYGCAYAHGRESVGRGVLCV